MLEPDTDESTLLEILSSANQDRIADVFKELHAECRAMRDTELKLLPAFISVMAFIAASNILLLSRAKEAGLYLVVAVAVISVVFVGLLTFAMYWRFEHDHLLYHDLFFRIRVVRKYFGFKGFFPNRQHGHSRVVAAGLGTGYKQNQRVLLLTAGAVICTIAVGLANTCLAAH